MTQMYSEITACNFYCHHITAQRTEARVELKMNIKLKRSVQIYVRVSADKYYKVSFGNQ